MQAMQLSFIIHSHTHAHVHTHTLLHRSWHPFLFLSTAGWMFYATVSEKALIPPQPREKDSLGLLAVRRHQTTLPILATVVQFTTLALETIVLLRWQQ